MDLMNAGWYGIMRAKHRSGNIFRSSILGILLIVLCVTGVRAQDSSARKKEFREWEEVFKLRNKFLNGNYGSHYFMGVFDGRFIGPNDKPEYGIRSFTTAFDYLILGNNLLSLIVNLGYRADNISFLSADKIPDGKTYKLGCIWFYSIAGDKYLVDSVYSTKLNKMVPVENPYYAKSSRLKIDSTHVQVKMAGLIRKTKEGRKITYDTLMLPPIEGTGSWKDANNYDLVYEWMEFVFERYKDTFDIRKRQFSKFCPPDVKNCILQRYDTDKYLRQHNLTEMDLQYSLRDQLGTKAYDMINQENGKILTFGNFEVFRFFNDVYWRVASNKERHNPVWHSAFQYDKDVERNTKGLIDFVVLGYGAKNYIMPTVIPRNFTVFTQFEGVVIYQKGTEREGHSNKDDIWVNTLNGRMIDRNFYEYPHEPGILPLNDDGTVDRIYKIYAWKDKKLYWAYIYCGKHAGVRGGKPGKSFVEQVDNFRAQYQAAEYWYFVSDIDYHDDVKNNLGAFTQDLYNFVNKASGLEGKTVPSVNILLETQDPKNPKKKYSEIKKLVFFDDHTARLDPEGLIVPYEIEEIKDERLRRIRKVKLNLLGNTVYIEDLEDHLKNNKFSGSDVNKFNKKFLKERENFVEIPDSTEKTTEVYEKQAYDLTNVQDAKALLERVIQDIANMDYQIPQMEENVAWQRTNKVEHIEKRLVELEMSDQGGTEIHKKLQQEYEKEYAKLEKLEEDLSKMQYKREQLQQKQYAFRSYYIRSLESNLYHLKEKKSFILNQISEIEKNMKTLEDEGKKGTDAYLQMQQSLKNKDGEIQETTEKENEVMKVLAEQRLLKEQEQ